MKFLTLNIQHGGSKRVPRNLASLRHHDPDVMVLTEFRNNSAGDRVKARLYEEGWAHQDQTMAPPKLNGVLVAAKNTVPTH